MFYLQNQLNAPVALHLQLSIARLTVAYTIWLIWFTIHVCNSNLTLFYSIEEFQIVLQSCFYCLLFTDCTEKNRKYPVGMQRLPHTYTIVQYKLTQYSHPFICTTNHHSAHRRALFPSLALLPLTHKYSWGAIFKSPICIGNRIKIFFRLKQNVFSCRHQQF